MSTPTTATSSAHPKSVKFLKGLGWFAGIIIGISILINLIGGFGGGSFGGYTKTLEIEVATMEPQKMCGVKPGERRFSIPKDREIVVFVAERLIDITSTVRVNKTFPNELFEVANDGCVTVTFAVAGDFQKNAFVRQQLAITFR